MINGFKEVKQKIEESSEAKASADIIKNLQQDISNILKTAKITHRHARRKKLIQGLCKKAAGELTSSISSGVYIAFDKKAPGNARDWLEWAWGQGEEAADKLVECLQEVSPALAELLERSEFINLDIKGIELNFLIVNKPALKPSSKS